jgi:hypothetical protein
MAGSLGGQKTPKAVTTNIVFLRVQVPLPVPHWLSIWGAHLTPPSPKFLIGLFKNFSLVIGQILEVDFKVISTSLCGGRSPCHLISLHSSK